MTSTTETGAPSLPLHHEKFTTIHTTVTSSLVPRCPKRATSSLAMDSAPYGANTARTQPSVLCLNMS